MEIILHYNKFINDKSLYESVDDPELHSMIVSYVIDKNTLNEKSNFLDSIKNALSKTMLGSLSYIKMIDDIVDKMESIEKDLIKKSAEYDDIIEELEIKSEKARQSKNNIVVKKYFNDKRTKIEEKRNQEKKLKDELKKGLDLLKKTTGDNKRRNEYAKLKLKTKDLNIAEYEYNFAKERAEEQRDLNLLRDKYEKMKKEVEELVNIFN